MKKHYYRVSTESVLGKAISAFFDKCGEATAAAQAFAEKYGAKEYLESPLGMAGGVAMLCGTTEDAEDADKDVNYELTRTDANVFYKNPDLWKKVEVKGVGVCLEPNVADDFDPKTVEGRELTKAEEIEVERLALPVVSEMQLVALLNPKPVIVNGKARPIVMAETPSVFVYEPSAMSALSTQVLGPQWYLAVPFEAQATELSEVTEKEFYRRRMAALNVN